eukprot:TRINITY_DN15872_c0_g2_i1.p2 TRINITY_DN15872_c0_g2~~TRINITY_DN15872_c0_g2_i1.p2  ORF type:complete len:123 (-),score=11.53 TRINITY_DN15872_c0_g2_i1:650-1018(-)
MPQRETSSDRKLEPSPSQREQQPQKSEAEDLVSMLFGRLMFSRIEPNQSGSEQWLDDQAARQVKPWTQSLLRIIMVISVMGLANDFTSDHHTIDCNASIIIWSTCACWMVLHVEIQCNYPTH